MAKSGRINISQAETMRYKKIQNLISLLQGKGNTVAVDAILGNDFPSPIAFSLGRRIALHKRTLLQTGILLSMNGGTTWADIGK